MSRDLLTRLLSYIKSLLPFRKNDSDDITIEYYEAEMDKDVIDTMVGKLETVVNIDKDSLDKDYVDKCDVLKSNIKDVITSCNNLKKLNDDNFDDLLAAINDNVNKVIAQCDIILNEQV